MKKATERHFQYLDLIDSYYKKRDAEAGAIDLCIKFCLEDIESIDNFIKEWITEERDLGKVVVKLPRIPSFERLAIIYEKQGEFDKAIAICKQAISLGQNNPDQCYSPIDFQKRIDKLQKKMTS